MLSILLIIILLSLVVLKLSHRGIDINSLNIGNYHNKLKQRLETFLENKVYEYPSLEHFQSLVINDNKESKNIKNSKQSNESNFNKLIKQYENNSIKQKKNNSIKQKSKNNLSKKKMTPTKEGFTTTNPYYIKPPKLFNIKSIETTRLPIMGTFNPGTFYDTFAHYFRKNIYPIELQNTYGSRDNIEKIEKNEIQFGICQEDLVYKAIMGDKTFENDKDVKYRNIRFLCSLYYESFMLVTHQYSGILSWSDLRGKKIGFPHKKSGSFHNGIRLAELAGLNPKSDFTYYNAMSMNRLANMFLNKDVDAIYLTTNQKNPYLINLANQTKVRFIGTLDISEDKLKMAFPFGFRKYIDTSHYYPNINQTAFLETYATRALLVTNTDLEEDIGYKIVKKMFEHSDELKIVLKNYLFKKNLNSYVPDAFNPQEMFYVHKMLEIHLGAKKYYQEIGFISYSSDPKCAKYAGKGICPY